MRAIKIQKRLIGEGEPCFIIAEAGVNHNGNLDTAKELVKIAKNAGADAIKFQIYKTDSIVSKTARKAEYQKLTDEHKTQYDMLKKLELTGDDFKELADYSKELGIMFLSSPFDKQSADILESLDVPAYKIASGEITNYPLLKHIALKKKPMIISTGMATMSEIENAIAFVKQNGLNQLIILHCITSYPSRIEDLNLKVIQSMKIDLDVPIGFSDHSHGIYAPIAAIALGSSLIEKHFTLDKNMQGPDHKASLEPEELNDMIEIIRKIEISLGDGRKRVTEEEMRIREVARKSIVAMCDIPPGVAITEEMLDVKRPGKGLEPHYFFKLLGKKTLTLINKDEVISLNMIEGFDKDT